jgi:hypothetical protein
VAPVIVPPESAAPPEPEPPELASGPELPPAPEVPLDPELLAEPFDPDPLPDPDAAGEPEAPLDPAPVLEPVEASSDPLLPPDAPPPEDELTSWPPEPHAQKAASDAVTAKTTRAPMRNVRRLNAS